MKRFSQIFLYITIALLIIWQLPWCYSFFAAKPSKIPFSMYSSVLGDFLSMGNEDGKGVVRRVPVRQCIYTGADGQYSPVLLHAPAYGG